MNYKLTTSDMAKEREKSVLGTAWKRLIPLLVEEKKSMTIALVAILISSASTLFAPIIIAHTVDTFIVAHAFSGVLKWSAILFGIYIAGLVANYIQVLTMGGVGRRLLFNLRNAIFNKLQELPVAFFNQNKAGDIISRINNDTDKLNQFFSQALIQFIGNAAQIVGAGIFILSINVKLGAASLLPAALVLILTQMISAWVKRKSLASLRTTGSLSGEIQESLNNFKVIVAFNRLDYFRDKFKEANDANYSASVGAGIASNIFTPMYTLASTLGQLIVLAYGIHLIILGQFTLGLLIGFILYVNNFYSPLRQLAAVWSSLQLALAGLDRISEVLALESDMPIIVKSSAEITPHSSSAVMEFNDVSFSYPNGKEILHHISFSLEPGKTYALVGPTGGGKTTTASLMARFYDPTAGSVYLSGKDIRSYDSIERAKKIGFILQEPFLFAGTIKDNIFYGNDEYKEYTHEQTEKLLKEHGLDTLLSRFSQGLDTQVATTGESVSLGQKQLVAFIRAVLRKPELLILDEATANIDTVTEKLLEEILEKLPKTTTKVIIAHRLNTIENADEIYFVNSGEVTKAGTMEHAVDLLLHGKRTS